MVALVGTGSRALDAGCGTGRAAALLAARGLAGVGVDPDPAMADVAHRRLAAAPGWRVDVSTFEEWSPAADDAPFDLLPDGRREAVLAAVARAIEAHGGTYDHPYVCRLCAAQRL